ncbi:MAG: hypothetical protein AAB797_02170 [Patescibacteria group bacterium]
MSEPMITIKKADGTFAKVPLSEFKKIQAAQKSPAPVMPPKPVMRQQPALASRPVAKLSGSIAPTNSAGRHNNAKPPVPAMASPGKMSRADAGSPLEEKLRVKSSAPLFSPKREKQVEEVLGKLGFSVVPEVLGRLKSLVLAKLKDIKSEDETRELLARSIKNGGLGLTEQQVEKIIKSCREVEGGGGMENTNVPVLKGNSFSTAMHSLESELELPAPVSKTSVIPTTKEESLSSRPYKTDRDPSSAKASLGMTNENRQEVVSKIVNKSAANEPIFKLDTKPVIKKSMQDVTASSIEMGPVEEIKSITLTDFRRLSGNPEEAAKRLQQKMFNLQEESFVWYLDALAAYHVSPLYSEYMQAVCQSLAERKSLANVLNMKNSIKLNEAVALMEMERGL